MEDFDVVARVDELCKARSWTYYRLAKASGIPCSTLNTMLRKSNMPSLPSLMKICEGFQISLGQFFSAGDETARLTESQKECLALWDALDESGKALAAAYMKGIADRQQAELQ